MSFIGVPYPEWESALEEWNDEAQTYALFRDWGHEVDVYPEYEIDSTRFQEEEVVREYFAPKIKSWYDGESGEWKQEEIKEPYNRKRIQKFAEFLGLETTMSKIQAQVRGGQQFLPSTPPEGFLEKKKDARGMVRRMLQGDRR